MIIEYQYRILLRREHYARQRIQVVELQPIDIENAIREHEGGSRPPNLAQDPVSKVEVPGTSLGIHGDCILRIQLVKLRPGCKVAE